MVEFGNMWIDNNFVNAIIHKGKRSSMFMSQNKPVLVDHKEYGKGLAINTSQAEDKSTRIFIVWQDTERAGVVCGWYVFDETDFIKD
jgi:hypothetical protein